MAVGFGIPVTLDRRTGAAAYSTHLPLAGVPFADVMSERLGLPVVVDNDGNCAVLAETRFGAWRGRVGRGDADTRDRDRRRAGDRREVAPGLDGAGGEFGHWSSRSTAPRAGQLPGRGCLEVMASGSALGARPCCGGSGRPPALERALAAGG